MTNAKKYITLLKREIAQSEKAEYCNIGLGFNIKKRDAWLEKLSKTQAQQEALTEIMTQDEIDHVMNVTGCEV